MGEPDEWIELYNAGSSALHLEGSSLDDGEGGSEPYRMPEGTVLPPGGFVLFYGRTTAVVLDDRGCQPTATGLPEGARAPVQIDSRFRAA
jgi:hypothetical protein